MLLQLQRQALLSQKDLSGTEDMKTQQSSNKEDRTQLQMHQSRIKFIIQKSRRHDLNRLKKGF